MGREAGWKELSGRRAGETLLQGQYSATGWMAGQGREASISNTGFPSDESSDPRLSRPLVSPETHLLHGAIDSALLLLPLFCPYKASSPVHPPASQPARSPRWYSAHSPEVSVLVVLKNTLPLLPINLPPQLLFFRPFYNSFVDFFLFFFFRGTENLFYWIVNATP